MWPRMTTEVGGEYQWKWAATRDLSKLLGTPFGLKLVLQDIDHFSLNRVKSKLEYRSSTKLSLAGCTLVVNQVLMSAL